MEGSLKNKIKLFGIAAGVSLGALGVLSLPITGVVYHHINENTLADFMQSERFIEQRDQNLENVEQAYKNGEITYEESIEKSTYFNSKEYAGEELKLDYELGENYTKSTNIEDGLVKGMYAECALAGAANIVLLGSMLVDAIKTSKAEKAEEAMCRDEVLRIILEDNPSEEKTASEENETEQE